MALMTGPSLAEKNAMRLGNQPGPKSLGEQQIRASKLRLAAPVTILSIHLEPFCFRLLTQPPLTQ